MQYIIWGVLTLSGILKRRNKLILGLILAFMFILYGLNTGCSDNENYKNLYFFLESHMTWKASGQEMGFVYLVKLFILLGFDYQQFRMGVFLLGMLMIHVTIRRFTQNMTYVFALYFIAPFFSNVMQIRNFLAEALLIFAVPFLLEKGKKGVFKFFGCIILSTLIQYSFCFFILLPLAKIDIYYLKKIVFVGLGVLFGCLSILPALAGKISFIPSYKITKYLGTMDLGSRFVIRSIFVVVQTALVVYICSKYRQLEHDEEKVIISDLFEKINLIMLFAYPLLMYSGVFYRLYRNILCLNYVVYANCIFKTNFGKDRIMVMLLIISCSLFMLLFDQMSALNDIFVNNLLWYTHER